MAQILDGLKVSKEVKAEIKEEVEKILANKRRAPHLVAILVGNNGASKAYVNSKVKDCEEVGFSSSLLKFPSTVSEAELLEKIDELN
ncbi:MAG: bifunctional 5,10-methylene-tetrahydrofolate dehydrogenase/5,10-methylene-tetrahydrofolate cyclohydrolase, partial [Chryseobacterium sp.]|nr:bifunctional 5,10-methylene-tetrahydrofolate dehydrogenase/5,10-methylene-tetrahydrofolate cyclohydrolase [Chryseobacterium sp.]